MKNKPLIINYPLPTRETFTASSIISRDKPPLKHIPPARKPTGKFIIILALMTMAIFAAIFHNLIKPNV